MFKHVSGSQRFHEISLVILRRLYLGDFELAPRSRRIAGLEIVSSLIRDHCVCVVEAL